MLRKLIVQDGNEYFEKHYELDHDNFLRFFDLYF